MIEAKPFAGRIVAAVSDRTHRANQSVVLQIVHVIADPLGQARRMAEFCGLPFEPAMVDIERSNEPVATASSVLLRDGMRSDRSRLWSAYAEQLRPLVEAFS